MKLVSVAQMKNIEHEADAGGLPYAEMMERAGQGVADVVAELPLQKDDREVFGLVGPGNNGGDSLVALSHLAADGWRARAYLVRRSTDALAQRFERAGGEIIGADEDLQFSRLDAFLQTAAVVLDGVLGTGTKPPLRDETARVLGAVQQSLARMHQPPHIVAVDCPSGIDCDTGEIDERCLAADITVTMAAVKQGLLKMPAYSLIGELKVVDIGIAPQLPALVATKIDVADEDMIASFMPPRPMDSHKGTFGSALIVAGSTNYTGAAWLAGEAAYRVGAGLVTLAVPGPVHAALAGQLPEATWILLPDVGGAIAREAATVLVPRLPQASAVLVGPGIGMAKTTQGLVQALVRTARGSKRTSQRKPRSNAHGDDAPGFGRFARPLVVDADGLRLIAGLPGWQNQLGKTAVLTPHPGEMAALTGLSKEDIQSDREVVAQRFAREWGHVVVLKGAFTVIAGPDGRTTMIPVASAALARAGTGDVLAGLVVGLLAQGVEAFEAAVAAAWVHAQAGLYASSRLGNDASVLASDVLNSVSDVISDLTG